jgi:toxin ParE1/3/4
VARFRLTGPARADLSAILHTSEAGWGEPGRRRYASLLERAFQTIARDPAGPLTRIRADVLPEIRSFHVKHAGRDSGVKAPVHVIYFRVARSRMISGMIEVVRVLHERMEPGLHVAPRRPKRHSRAAR